ncbi:MAG: hypothetical protein KC503_07055 [Myxococcales bacterium]|nr:hypothetical protein [Myxococcales bacterium]
MLSDEMITISGSGVDLSNCAMATWPPLSCLMCAGDGVEDRVAGDDLLHAIEVDVGDGRKHAAVAAVDRLVEDHRELLVLVAQHHAAVDDLGRALAVGVGDRRAARRLAELSLRLGRGLHDLLALVVEDRDEIALGDADDLGHAVAVEIGDGRVLAEREVGFGVLEDLFAGVAADRDQRTVVQVEDDLGLLVAVEVGDHRAHAHLTAGPAALDHRLLERLGCETVVLALGVVLLGLGAVGHAASLVAEAVAEALVAALTGAVVGDALALVADQAALAAGRGAVAGRTATFAAEHQIAARPVAAARPAAVTGSFDAAFATRAGERDKRCEPQRGDRAFHWFPPRPKRSAVETNCRLPLGAKWESKSGASCGAPDLNGLAGGQRGFEAFL